MSVEVERALLTIVSDPKVVTDKLTISDERAGKIITKQGKAHRAGDRCASLKNMARQPHMTNVKVATDVLFEVSTKRTVIKLDVILLPVDDCV